ncbi:MAG: BrnT family toxin [Selenomonadaceae bacterium]|nr:BrnT family toxin [Selenomonadaceae bacterium]
MDVNYELGDLKFVWDSDKSEINLKKHRIAFEDAARVFLDEYRLDDYDENHSNFEERFKTIGFVRNVLAVIYTEREDINRIISARRATKREEEEYYGQFEQ